MHDARSINQTLTSTEGVSLVDSLRYIGQRTGSQTNNCLLYEWLNPREGGSAKGSGGSWFVEDRGREVSRK